MKTTPHTLRGIFAALAAFLSFTSLAPANGFPALSWRGTEGPDWTAPNNWANLYNPNFFESFSPGAYVSFPDGSLNTSATDLNGNQTVSSLTINTSDDVGIVGGSLTINGTTNIGIDVSGADVGNVMISAPLIFSGNSTDLYFDNPNKTNLVSSISSSNPLYKKGGGALTVTGNLTAGGSLNINSGTLTLGQGAALTVAPGVESMNALFVANEARDSVSVFNLDNNNTFIRSIENLKDPYSLAVAPDGNIYVATTLTKNMSVFSNNGTFLKNISGIGNFTYGLAIDSTGKIYATESNSPVIRTFAPNGTQTGNFSGFTPAQFGITWSSSTDKIYVTAGSGVISSFNTNGTFSGNLTGNFVDTRGIVADSAGKVYLTSYRSYFNEFYPEVKEIGYFLGGCYTTLVSGNMSVPFYLALSQDELLLYVSNAVDDSVSIFSTANGSQQGVITGGDMNRPMGLDTGIFTVETPPEGITLAASASDNATLNIGTFGGTDTSATLDAPAIVFGSGTAAMNFNLAGNFTLSANLTGGNSKSSLNQLGTGTTTLSGNNTFNGSTTITAGTLQIGAGGTSGSFSGNITNNATLVFNRSDNSTFSGRIGGTGNVTKQGAGILTLSGSSNYTGSTAISAGTLALTGSLASTSISIASGAALQNQNGGLSANASVANAGSFTINGTETIGSLAGNGSIVLSAALTTGGLGTNDEISGTISGGSALTKVGNGTLSLTGNATNTGGLVISNGTLSIGNGGTTGSVSGNIANNATLIFNRSDNSTFSGSIGGTGNVTKQGAGILTLSGSSNYTGSTAISAGTLAVTGSLANATTQVNSGGTLAGTGTLGSVTINTGGTIAPGNSPGTITVGNMTWNSGGTYAWELGNATGTAGTGWDLIRSTTGNLTINATSGSKFIIAASTNSSASGFNPNAKSYSWKIAEFLNISGFAADAFDIQRSGFDNLPAIHVFSVSSNNTTLSLNYATAATWIGGTGNWTDTSMWQGGFVPINGLAVDYAGTNGTSTNDSSLANIGGLAFDSEAGAYTLAGGNLSIGAGGIVNNSTFTQTVGINLALGANQTFAANTANLLISGDISGGYALTKEGIKTLTFSGTNTYTGETTINAGTLAVAQGGSLAGTSKIFVGNTTSSNTMSILGTVSTTDLTLSHQVGSNDNTLTVGGGSSPASLTVSNLINVGFGGTGNKLDILGNGTVTAASTWIGGYGANNTLNLNGGVLNSTSDIIVGYFSDDNELNITAGGNATVGSITVGLDAGSSNNTILVSGSGSALHTAGLIYLGENGTANRLVIENGGKVISQNLDAVIGLNAGSNGNALTINGTGSQFTNNGTLQIGRNGSENSLTVQNGASLVTKNSRIGREATSSNNTATVSGNGSKWTNTGTLRVGDIGSSNNTLAVTSGANVTISGNTFIGHGAGSDNNLVSVSGAGSVLNLANATVGPSGSNNTLLVADSGTINAFGIQLSGTNSTLQIGNGTAAGTITTSLGIGTGSGTGHQVVFNHTDSNLAFSPILTGNLSLSQIGTGTTALTANNIFTGSTTISAGTLSLGNGSTSGSVTGDITNNSALVFNRSNDSTYSGNITGTGTLGKLGAGVLTLANSTNTVGTTTITAGGLTLSASSLTTNGGVNINTGTLTIAQDGTLDADPVARSNGITLAASASDNATLNIGTFGGSDTTATLGAKFIQFGTGTGNLNLNRAADEIFLTEFLGGGANSTINQLGTGTTTIASFNNTFAGTANIKAGTLEVSGALANATIVAQGGTLAGSGTVGDTTVLATGTINPNGGTPVGGVSNGSGSYIGTLTVGNLTLNGGATYNWQTSSNGTFGTAGTDWDLISSLGALTLNATSGNPITISLSTLDGSTLAGVKKASWEIGNFTTGITGFDKSAFSFNATSMEGNSGRYFMTLGGGNTTLVLNYKTAATWNTGSGNWTTAAQWENDSLPANGDEVEFIGLGGTSTNNFASGNLSNISGFTFVEGAGAYIVNGNTLEIGQDGIVNSSTEHQTIGMNLTAGEVLVVDAFNGSIEISGVVSGASALSKTGSEALILTANNTYTGGTTISAGMLAIGGETGAVAGTITVEAGATFAVERTNNATITNLISGSGSFAQLGTGVTSIIGNNTYAGGTSIIYGTLWAKSAGALGNGSTTVGQNFAQMSTLSIPSTSPALLVSSTQEMGGNLLVGGDLNWYDGTIAFYDTGTSPASGDLTINVGGNFSVSTSTGNATFDFSGVEALDAGVYTLINATSILADGTNFVAAHGQYTTLFGNFTTTNHTVVYTVTGAESTGPNIQNNGGPNTPVIAVFDVTQATQTIGANNTVNALNFTNNAPLTIQTGGQLTLTGGNLNVLTGNSVISGGTLNTTGNLTKLGSGELDLQSNTNVNGMASVVDGLLSINGNLTASLVVIDPDGTLGGAGRIVSPNVQVNGNLAPGNSPGILSISGNLTLGSGTTTIQIASPTSLDGLNVSGQLTLGGTLTAQADPSGSITLGTPYDFLQAASIVGEFDELVAPDGLRIRFLNSGTVGTLIFGPESFVPYAINQNERNVAAALNTFVLATNGDALTVGTALDSLTAAQYPAAFDAIMPGFYETLGDMVIEQAYNQTQLLNQRLGSVRLGATGFQAIGMSQPLKYDIDGDSVAEASTLDFVSAARGENGIWTPARIGRMAGSAPAAPAPYAPLGTNWNSWVMGIGEFAMSRGLSGVPNYNNNAGGFLAGADYRFGPTLSAGVYAGYQYNYAKYDNGSSTQGNSALFGLYASYANEGGYYADAVIGGGYTGFQTRRSIEFPGIDRTATADPGSGQFSAALNLGKDFQVGKFTLGPIVGAQYTYAGIGSFTESGADSLNLSLDQQNVNSLRTNLGARLAYNWEICKNTVLIPEVRGFWMHEFLNNPANITSSLNGGAGPSFDYETETPYRDSIFGGVGVSAKLGDRWSASAFYNVNFGAAGYTNNIISTTLGFSF